MNRRNAEAELQLPPGFRFFPTDEELVVHYLCRRAASQSLPVPIIAEVDLYKYDPWQLPEKALFGEKEWYFFTPRDRKYPNGSRPNRAAGSGYWKATGADKPITTGGGSKRVGIKKALVFYAGRAPRGTKSNWIMHEYRLADVNRTARKKGSLRLDDWVLCRIYNKKSSAEKIELEHKECSSLDEAMQSFEACDKKEMQNLCTLNLAVNSIQQSSREQPKPSFDHFSRLNPSPSNCSVICHDDLPVKCEIDCQNPLFTQNTSTFNSGTLTAPIPPPAFNPISSSANQWTNYTSADLDSGLHADSSSSKPSSSDPISEKEEVQSSFRLENFLEEDHQSLFNFGLEGLQNPFLQFDQMSSSNPYEEYIAGLAASDYLPRFYQNDMLMN